jgi:hypothetical protein
LTALEEKAGSAAEEGPRVLFARFKPGELKSVVASEYWPAMDRLPTETEEQFEARCYAAAKASAPPGRHFVLLLQSGT